MNATAGWFRWDEEAQLQQLVNEAFEGANTHEGAEAIVTWFERTRLDRFHYHVEKARTAHDGS